MTLAIACIFCFVADILDQSPTFLFTHWWLWFAEMALYALLEVAIIWCIWEVIKKLIIKRRLKRAAESDEVVEAAEDVGDVGTSDG